jgi:hypothetical protein
VGEFAQFLIGDVLQGCAASDPPPLPPVVPLRMYPGTAAIMMLPRTAEAHSYLPHPLRSVTPRLGQRSPPLIGDLEVITWLNEQIEQLDRTTLSEMDIDTIFERPPTLRALSNLSTLSSPVSSLFSL